MAKKGKNNPVVGPTDATKSGEDGNFFGSLCIAGFLTSLCYAFTLLCNDISGCPVPSILSPSTITLQTLKKDVGWPSNGVYGLVNYEVCIKVLCYYAFNLTLYKVLPGKVVNGVKLSCGGHLEYKLTAWSAGLVTITLCAIGTLIYGPQFPVWTFINDNFLEILTAAVLTSYALATFSYLWSFGVTPKNKELRQLAKSSGDPLTNWAFGRELNPRITLPLLGEIDIKEYSLYHPGLVTWLILDYAFISKQYQTYGYVTDSIVLVAALQTFYMLDAFWIEERILKVMDVTDFGFGFLLSFGNFVWVPFISSLQVRYLSAYPVTLGLWKSLTVLFIFAAGYWIFRASNNEKYFFRENPNDPRVSHLRYIKTGKSNLLISGWWGRARHINYFGDWLMAWAYSLPTGLAGYIVDSQGATKGNAAAWGMCVTYFYVVYFGLLLVDRADKDDIKCAAKYGDDWKKYTKLVKSKFIPGLY